MGTVTFPQLPYLYRIFDIILKPLMFILAGFKVGDIQHTHTWHAYKVLPELINMELSVETNGSVKEKMKRRFLFLFHIPIIGGWKDYTVYEVNKSDSPFFIGWVYYDEKTKKLIDSSIHRLRINGNKVKLLDGPSGYKGNVFAVNGSGQIKISKVGNGRLGDNKYPKVPLY